MSRTRRALALVGTAVLTVGLVAPAAAQETEGPPIGAASTERFEDLRLDSPRSATAEGSITRSKLVGGLLQATGSQRVVVRLTEPSVAETVAEGRRAPQAQRQQRQRIERQQARVAQRAAQLGATELARTENAVSSVILEVDADELEALAALPEVERIAPVVDYELDLAETVPYIGAAAVQAGDGVPAATGEGVLIAVIDSGVDYTHEALGGPGTPEAFEAAYGTSPDDPRNRTIDPEVFPTDRVVAGFDFTGEFWVGGAGSPPEQPNPNPIDIEGHGTSVADIAAGTLGVAPGADIVAIKACASFSSACSGVALIQAVDFALDPFETGTLDRPVDIMNMSLGANYGIAFDNDLSFAVDNASALGVLTVSSAGNGGDKPFITGTPSSAPTALAVAQTALPSDVLQLWDFATGEEFPAVAQLWAPALEEAVTAPTIHAGALGNALGCAPFTQDLTGLIVVMDRGECNFTLKAVNANNAGAAVAVIAQVTSEGPFTGGDGGDRPIDIPSFMVGVEGRNLLISQQNAAGGPVETTFDPARGLDLAGTVVASSSRGPSQDAALLKPEIGAPGASTAAVAGSGTDTAPFGGTSGASPMVAGSAALLMELYPERSWAEIKAVLMNTAETEVFNGSPDLGVGLAPISRIGGGEVRVDRAAAATSAAWVDAGTGTVGIGLGQVDVTGTSRFTETVTVANYGTSARTYSITPSFRFAEDEALGAVRVQTPGSVRVPAGQTRDVRVTITIDGAALRDWNLSSGPQGDSGDALTVMELDGYLTFTAGDGESVHVPWHVLPRKSSDIQVTEIQAGSAVQVRNRGVGTSFVESFSLLGTSPRTAGERLPGEGMPPIDLQAVGVQEFEAPFCDAGVLYVFGNATWDTRTHAIAPATFIWVLDVDGDGVPDFEVLNWDLSYPGIGDGRNLTWSFDLETGAGDAFFFTDHDMGTGFTGLTVCGEQIGIDSFEAAQGTQIGVEVLAFDLYYRGQVTDVIGDTSFRVGELRTDMLAAEVAPRERVRAPIVDNGTTGTGETGVLWRFGNGPEGNEVHVTEFRSGPSRPGGGPPPGRGRP